MKSDGDGIGCELALLRALQAMGKEVRIINDTAVPRPLRFLEEDPSEILVYDPARDGAFLSRADAIVVLDVGLTYRLGRMEEAFLRSGATKICLTITWTRIRLSRTPFRIPLPDLRGKFSTAS